MQLNPAKMARPVHADGRRYVPAIDGLRCLAAYGVISAHIGSEFGPSQNLVAYYGSAAYPSLIVFFTISGFLVYRPFVRSILAPKTVSSTDRSTSPWIYLLRRVLRIFPLYWTVLAVSVLLQDHAVLGLPAAGIGQLHGFTDWVQAIFLLPFPHPTHLLSGPLGIAMWTLAIELPFYALVPLYAAGTKALRRRFAPHVAPFEFQLGAVLVFIGFIFTIGLVFGGELAFPVMSLPTGMLLAILETRQALIRRRYRLIRLLADNWWLCIGLYVGLVFLGARLALDAYARPGVTDPFAAIRSVYFPIQMSQALLIFVPIAFGVRKSLLVRAMAAAPLQILAPLTYGVYLWHVPLLQRTEARFGAGFLGFPIPGTHGFGMPTIFLALVLALMTFVIVELPAAKLRDAVDRWSRGRGTARPKPARDQDPPNPVDVDADADPDSDADPDGEAEAEADTARRPPVPAASRPTPTPTPTPTPASAMLRRASSARSRPAPPAAPATPSVASGTSPVALATPWCEPIDGFRAICACLAVAGHTFLASSIIPFVGTLDVLGILVALFFAISAYVLYQPFLEADVRRLPRPKAGGFYLRRLLRIYPLFALALTAILVFIPAVRPDNAWGFVRLYLFLQIFGRELSVFKGIPAAWYLSNEVIFYLSMPLMALAAARWSNRRGRTNPKKRLRAHLAIGWGLVLIGPFTRTAVYLLRLPAPTSLPFSHLEFFGFGIVVAAYAVGTRIGVEPPSVFRWLRDHTATAYTLVLVPVAMEIALASLLGNGSGLWRDGDMEDRLRFFPYLLAIGLLMTAATLGSPRDRSNRWLSSSFFKPLSGLALHIYLWQELVLGLMNKLFDGSDKVLVGNRFLTGVMLVAGAIGASFLVARASQPLTDWPYERYRAINGRLRGRAAAPQPAGLRPTHPKMLEPQVN